MNNDNNSLTSQDFWDLKPFWCQPWSILLTGIILIALTIWWPHRALFTVFVLISVLLWWGLFLFLAPISYRQEYQSAKNQEEG